MSAGGYIRRYNYIRFIPYNLHLSFGHYVGWDLHAEAESSFSQ